MLVLVEHQHLPLPPLSWSKNHHYCHVERSETSLFTQFNMS